MRSSSGPRVLVFSKQGIYLGPHSMHIFPDFCVLSLRNGDLRESEGSGTAPSARESPTYFQVPYFL